MSRLIERTHRWIVAAAVLAALTVGAGALLAMPTNMTCPNPPNNGGTCADLTECQQNCDAIFGIGGWVDARCGINGCCRCYL